MAILRVSFGVIILALSLASEVQLLVVARRGFRLLGERRASGWHSPESIKRHLRGLWAFVVTTTVMILVIVGGIRLFALPLTPFYYHVHLPLIKAFVGLLIGASVINGKRFPWGHIILTPLVILAFTIASITGDMLVVSLFFR